MGNTMFHLVNAYTRAPEFEGLSAEASHRLQKVGGIGVLSLVGCSMWINSASPLALDGARQGEALESRIFIRANYHSHEH